MSSEGTTRISVEVTNDVNEKLNKFLPWGSKAEIVRQLIHLMIQTQEGTNHYIAQDILQGRCKLVVTEKLNG